MLKREQLERSIAAIEAQRSLLGEAAAETALRALHSKLLALSAHPQMRTAQQPTQRKQVTILFARISGFSRVAESLRDTNTLDLMNRLWRRLDRAITDQGGTVDKHVGDGVMGVFGVPLVQEDDPERAVRAALAMRGALGDFVGQVSRSLTEDDALLDQLHALEMRIGINTGSVLFGEMGTSDEYTVIGDAVNVASRVTDAAPPGGILISHDTYLLTRGIFNIEPLGPVAVKGKTEPIPVYLTLGVNPRLFFPVGRGVEGVETHMVGRDGELQTLQLRLNRALMEGRGGMVTVVGEAGVGKSRLIYEFSNWMRQYHSEVVVFKGRTDQQMRSLPYSLVRDVVTSAFEIQDNDLTAVAETKLRQGVQRLLGGQEPRELIHAIGQLIGLGLAESLAAADGVQGREQLFRALLGLFRGAAQLAGAAVIFFEDIHWADDGSLNAISYLAEAARSLPLLIVCLARPTLFEQRSAWPEETVMSLEPLTENHVRRLVWDILRKLPTIPNELADLIVNTAEGNPYYVEELIKILIEDGIIITGGDEWQLRESATTQLRLPPTLNGVLQARLDRLSAPERVTLQRAAVVGRIFWDDAVMVMNRHAPQPFTAEETLVALQVLSKRELIFRRKSSAFAGISAYTFKHAILRQVAYDSVLLRDRPLYHKQVGDWLLLQSGERVAEYAGAIAEHYELAGEETLAAEMHERAAVTAAETFEMVRAIDHYQRVLALLTDKPQFVEGHLRVQERLGGLLMRQARLAEAEESFVAMQGIARTDGDLVKEAQAWLGLAQLYRQQADYQALMEASSQAEDVAWLIGADLELAEALRYKALAVWQGGDWETAVLIAERALDTSRKLASRRSEAASLKLLADLHLLRGDGGLLTTITTQLTTLVENIESTSLLPDRAFVCLKLGELHLDLEQFGTASRWLQRALGQFQALELQDGTAATLMVLAEVARRQGEWETAVLHNQEAQKSLLGVGNRLQEQAVGTQLAAAFLGLRRWTQAEQLLYPVIEAVEQQTVKGNWYLLGRVYRLLATAYLGQGQVGEAQLAAQRALRLVVEEGEGAVLEQTAVWQLLGEIGAQAPAGRQTMLVDGVTYDPAGCFAQGWQLLRDVKRGSNHARVALLLAWAAYETVHGDAERGRRLRRDAEAAAARLGVPLKT
ncbi:MAG: AAA family ATPase [Ardenticatenaceae bacterium]|nr:AAA family ATPase [Ardenticatenaceae bacterium]